MSEWKEYRLGDFIEFNPKISLKKDVVARKIAMDQLVPYSRDIYSWSYEPYSGGAKFQNGDTIMARITPCLENGKHAYISLLDEKETAFGSTEYIVMRGKENISDNKFVYYLTHYPFFKNAAVKSMVGSSGRQRAQVVVLENLTMNLPSLSEQIRIAEMLSEIDDKIAVNRRICENLEAQAQALFKHWFIDFAPFKNGKFVESELGMIPEGWRVGTLGEIAVITMGQSPAGSSYNEKGEGVIFYQGRTEFGFRYPSVRLYTTEPKRFAEPLSTLLSVRAPVGDINVATERCCIGRGLASIKSNKNCHSYIFYLLQSMKRRFDVYNGEGTVFGSINKDTLNGLKIFIPNNTIISDFEEIVEEIDKKILESHQESSRLSSLRDTLLPKLMSGEIKV